VRLLIVVLAAAVLVDALVGDQGFLAMWRADQSTAQLTAALERTRAENARLSEEIERMRTDDKAIEDAARRDLMLIRKGEKIFIIKDLPSPSGVPPAAPCLPDADADPASAAAPCAPADPRP
jgi:cell division protein FtsB